MNPLFFKLFPKQSVSKLNFLYFLALLMFSYVYVVIIFSIILQFIFYFQKPSDNFLYLFYLFHLIEKKTHALME